MVNLFPDDKTRDWRDVHAKLCILLEAGVHKPYHGFFHRLLITLFDQASNYMQNLRKTSDYKEHIDEERTRLTENVLSICRLLIKHGANLSVRGILISAVRYGSVECVQTLLENGVPIDDSDEDSNTALHHCFGAYSTFLVHTCNKLKSKIRSVKAAL